MRRVLRGIVLGAALVAAWTTATAAAQDQYVVTTVAGASAVGSVDGTGADARFFEPYVFHNVRGAVSDQRSECAEQLAASGIAGIDGAAAVASGRHRVVGAVRNGNAATAIEGHAARKKVARAVEGVSGR